MMLFNVDKDMRVGPTHIPGRKKPALIFQYANAATICGTFTNDEMADVFMKFLAEMVGAKGEEESKCLR